MPSSSRDNRPRDCANGNFMTLHDTFTKLRIVFTRYNGVLRFYRSVSKRVAVKTFLLTVSILTAVEVCFKRNVCTRHSNTNEMHAFGGFQLPVVYTNLFRSLS